MSSSSSNVRNILHLPDEILANIILHFDARERLALANTCTRFNTLVFGDKELLRDLDFSNNGRLTTPTDIQQYFGPKIACEFVRRVNIQSVKCIRAGRMLNESIGKAINLVDLNIHGTNFKDLKELGDFLEPLLHLKKFSVDWPKRGKNDVDVCSSVLEKPFARLTYLSVIASLRTEGFFSAVKLCKELQELRMATILAGETKGVSFSKEPEKLGSLKIVRYHGQTSSWNMKRSLADLVQDPNEWTDFYFVNQYMEGYLEKNLEVCHELWEIRFPDARDLARQDYDTNHIGWPLLSENLLDKVFKINYGSWLERFCCLGGSESPQPRPCLLKIDEAKELLKDPEHPISYLYFKHSIEPDCDAHLVVSAFPNLTELVFTHLGRRKYSRRKRNFQRRLTRRGSIAAHEDNDPQNRDSSFKMLVENTPNLKDLTIAAMPRYNQWGESTLWDLDALRLISGWKNLTAIRLRHIPIIDGKFLIDIGKECVKLEELQLFYLGPKNPCCYTSDLSQMLPLLKSLRKFSICQRGIENMSELLAALSNLSKLEFLRLMTKTEEYDSAELVSSVEQLLRRCSALTKFIFMIQSARNRVQEELSPALRRITGELNRQNFQFHGPVPRKTYDIYEDVSASFFSSPSDDRQFAYY